MSVGLRPARNGLDTSGTANKTGAIIQIPPATRYKLEVGDLVRIYRENSRKWERPFRIARLNIRLVWVTDGNTTKTFSITAVITAGIKGRDDDMSIFTQTHKILKATHNSLTEVLETRDPRCQSEEGMEAMKKEISGLNQRCCFKVVN